MKSLYKKYGKYQSKIDIKSRRHPDKATLQYCCITADINGWYEFDNVGLVGPVDLVLYMARTLTKCVV